MSQDQDNEKIISTVDIAELLKKSKRTQSSLRLPVAKAAIALCLIVLVLMVVFGMRGLLPMMVFFSLIWIIPGLAIIAVPNTRSSFAAVFAAVCILFLFIFRHEISTGAVFRSKGFYHLLAVATPILIFKFAAVTYEEMGNRIAAKLLPTVGLAVSIMVLVVFA